MVNRCKVRKLELLAPARNAEIAIEAIRHGADAVYMGPPSHGARKMASNSIDDIRRVVDFAHIFKAKVYCTVNTIVYDREIRGVEKLIADLWRIGVDALIVQDMGILRMDIPPIALHASTQCDIRTPGKARFLEEVGFSQLVLARELSIEEIEEIAQSVDIPIETFVHGALCTGFSGRCQAGFASAGRSGNRGECPQICRLPFTLKDANGKVLAKDRYLLSLKDFRAFDYMEKLVEAGVSSFKIEGRLKDADYVKNVVAAYSRRLDSIISERDGLYERSSFGDVTLRFEPDLNKSFNRGFTSYRLSGNIDKNGIASPHTPKSQGELIKDINQLNPGDGISWMNDRNEYEGLQVNAVKGDRIIGNRPFVLPKGVQIRRTSDVNWKKLMATQTAERKLAVDITMDPTGFTALDETGGMSRIASDARPQPAGKPQDYRRIFSKLGNTPFRLRNFENRVEHLFYPASILTELRRSLIDHLVEAKKMAYPIEVRREENRNAVYPDRELSSSDNVANRLALEFYKQHGVGKIEPAVEVKGRQSTRGSIVMTSKHCILREIGLCRQKAEKPAGQLVLSNGNLRFGVETDCDSCEMRLRQL